MTKPILLAFFLLSVLLVAGALIGSTQYAARELRYDRRLGPPATRIAGVPIYEPWAWLEGDQRFRRYAPRVFGTANVITYGTLVASLALLLVAALLKGRSRGGSTSHGSARWGTTEELRKGGMLGSEGIVLCQTAEARFSSSLNDQGALQWRMRAPEISSGTMVPSMCSCEPPLAGDSSPFSLMFLGTEWDSAPNPGTSYAPENRRPAPSPRGRPSHHPRTYTLEKANELASALRALPAKDPAQRRLDKQAVIRHIAEEIMALQQRGYTLEEIAQAITTEDVVVTTPTLKSYLERIRKAARGKGGRKAPRASALPLVLRGGGH